MSPAESQSPVERPARPGSAPVDLELRVTTVPAQDGLALQYELSSPSGVVDYYRQPAGVQPIGSEESFRQALNELYDQLEKLHGGLDVDDGKLVNREIEDDLVAIGLDLYTRLFSAELRTAYRKIRDKVNTLLIVSDDRWGIPWELIRPFEEDGIDDDFLGVRFQLTRWLAGTTRPAGVVRVHRMAAVGAGASHDGPRLPSAEKEHALLADLTAGVPGVEDASLPAATFRQLKDLLEGGGLGLLHFVGHGDQAGGQAGEAKIELADRALRARHLMGPVQLRLKVDRPLVFLNACRVARQGWWLTNLAGWAERWVRGCGCGAFVGPLWTVNDRAALRFAEVFYRELRQGKTFGEATQAARRTVREEMPGRLTWMAYSVYAHPNGRLALGDQGPAVAAQRAGVPAEIRRGILDFGSFIAEKTDGFVGRQWLFDRLDEFLEEKPQGYFLLRGDPGIGKSALAAELVRQRGCVHHFNIRAEGINRPEDFLANVCAQLIATYGLPHTFLPPEATRDANFLKKLLEQVVERHPDEKVMVVVDALDEATGMPEGVNPLYLPTALPHGVFVLATSRRGTTFRGDEIGGLEIGQDEEGNLADVRFFVESKLERPGIRGYIEAQGLDEETFVSEMVGKSQGNFMYLRYVLPEIELGVYQDRGFDTLPRGLENYYEDHWQRMRSRDEEAWFNYQLPVLVALTVVKEPVSVNLIVDFSGVDDRRRIRQVLVEWDPFLYSTEVEDEEGNRQTRRRLYHASFQEFVERKDEVAGERVDLKKAHGKIADVLWQELYGGGGDAESSST